MSDVSALTGAPSVSQQGGRGHGRGGRRRGRRGNYNSRSSNSSSGGASSTPVRRGNSNYQGSEPSLQGCLYDYTGQLDSDGYIQTTKEVSIYIGRNYTKYTTELSAGFDALQLTMPEEPVQRTPPDPFEPAAWELEIELYKMQLEKYKAAVLKLEDRVKNGKLPVYRFFGGKWKAAQDIVQRQLIFETAQQEKRLSNCYAGTLNLVITANGDVHPCEEFSMLFGNVKEHDFDVTKVRTRSV